MANEFTPPAVFGISNIRSCITETVNVFGVGGGLNLADTLVQCEYPGFETMKCLSKVIRVTAMSLSVVEIAIEPQACNTHHVTVIDN